MDKIIQRIADIGIVPVITLQDAGRAVALGKALAAGGIPVAEVTYRTSAAGDAIRALADELPEVLVGAGTVLSVDLAKDAVAAGAKFVVMPAWDEGVVDFCLERGLPVFPGVSGPDGAARGLAKGLGALKFFPAEAAGGSAMLDALSGPFASVRFIPTGGIDEKNIGEYARRANVLAVGGSWMAKADLIEAGDWTLIERFCREAVAALHGFSLAHVGVNERDPDSATKDAATLSSLFCFAPREGSSSIFMSDAIELLKAPNLGESGHLAIRCNDVERALARLLGMGIRKLAGTERLEKGRLRTVYLDLTIAGFAVHLIRA